MLSVSQQAKIIEGLLKKPQNHYCADCGSKSPCWASLDFGVFVCMNCSGAHRSLGPVVTRIKSTTLDTWPREWVDNMQIGNTIVNQYWEGSLSNPAIKPNMNSSMGEIIRYVQDKYIKKRYVAKEETKDPLSRYKLGLPLTKEKLQLVQQKIETVQNVMHHQPAEKPKTEMNLLEFEPKKHISNNDFINFKFSEKNPTVTTPEKHYKHQNYMSMPEPVKNFIPFESHAINPHLANLHPLPAQNLHNPHYQGTFSSPQNIYLGNTYPSMDPFHQNYPSQHVTMNINMNMYPKVMNINMPACSPHQAPIDHSINMTSTIDFDAINKEPAKKQVSGASWANDWK